MFFDYEGESMKYIFVCLFFAVMVSGCSEQTNEPVSTLPYELWKSKNIHNYTIEQTRSCFCVDGGATVRITVLSDTIAGVIQISDSSKVTAPRINYYFTVDSLFGIIRSNKTDSLVVAYDTDYGFPKFLDINPQQHPVDGGVLYETSNLKIIK